LLQIDVFARTAPNIIRRTLLTTATRPFQFVSLVELPHCGWRVVVCKAFRLVHCQACYIKLTEISKYLATHNFLCKKKQVFLKPLRQMFGTHTDSTWWLYRSHKFKQYHTGYWG